MSATQWTLLFHPFTTRLGGYIIGCSKGHQHPISKWCCWAAWRTPSWCNTSRGAPALLSSSRTCCFMWEAMPGLVPCQTGGVAGGGTFLPAAPSHGQYYGTFPLVAVMQGNCSIPHNKLQLAGIMKWSRATNSSVHLTVSSAVQSLCWKKVRVLWQGRVFPTFSIMYVLF